MLKGFLAMIGASVLFGSLPTVNKKILMSGMSTGSLVFYAMLITAIGSAVVMLFTKRTFQVSRRAFYMMVLVGVLGMGGTAFLLNTSYEYIPVGLATMLHFMYPSLVCFTMVILFHEKFTKFKIGAIALSVLGMLFIVDLSGSIRYIGVIAAILSCFAYAFYIIGNERGSINELPLIVKLFYAASASTVVYGIPTVLSGGLTLPANGVVCFQLIGFSGMGTMGAFYLVTYGVKALGAAPAAFFNMLEPIVSMVESVLFFHDRLSGKTILGCVLVVSSVLLVAIDGTKGAKIPEEAAPPEPLNLCRQAPKDP